MKRRARFVILTGLEVRGADHVSMIVHAQRENPLRPCWHFDSFERVEAFGISARRRLFSPAAAAWFAAALALGIGGDGHDSPRQQSADGDDLKEANANTGQARCRKWPTGGCPEWGWIAGFSEFVDCSNGCLALDLGLHNDR